MGISTTTVPFSIAWNDQRANTRNCMTVVCKYQRTIVLETLFNYFLFGPAKYMFFFSCAMNWTNMMFTSFETIAHWFWVHPRLARMTAFFWSSSGHLFWLFDWKDRKLNIETGKQDSPDCSGFWRHLILLFWTFWTVHCESLMSFWAIIHITGWWFGTSIWFSH